MLEYTPESHAAAEKAENSLRLLLQETELAGNDVAVSIAMTAYAAGFSEAKTRSHVTAKQVPLIQETVDFLDGLVVTGKVSVSDISGHRNKLAQAAKEAEELMLKSIREALTNQYGAALANLTLAEGQMRDDDALEAGIEVRTNNPHIYMAFLSQHMRYHECRCPSCYSRAYQESSDTPAEAPRLALGFGGGTEATRQLGRWIVDHLRKSIPAYRRSDSDSGVLTEESHSALLDAMSKLRGGSNG
jgi:hypothetical protein